MRVASLSAATAALVVVAGCNQTEEAPPPTSEGGSEATGNVASPVDIATVMHDRHEHYHEMGKAMKGIGDALKSGAPSVEAIRRHAAVIAGYAPQIPGWFPAGSGPESGRRTRARAEIWTDPETFRRRAADFAAEAARFERTAQGGDLAAIRAGVPALGKACKDCHDRFRGPDDGHHDGGGR
jgi:cytochrome c556